MSANVAEEIETSNEQHTDDKADSAAEPSSSNEETSSEDVDQPAAEAQTSGEAQPDDVEITIGDAPVPKEEPADSSVIKALRREHREQARKIRELEQERAALRQTEGAAVPTLGKRPSLTDDGIDYDEEKFAAALEAWTEQKRQVDAAKRKAEEAAKSQAEARQQRLAGYSEAKAKLGVQDFDDAEAVVVETLSPLQQNLLLDACDNPALVAYALGKAPAKAKELAAITDPVRFVAAIARLEPSIKMSTTKKTPPAPEKIVSGGSRGGAVDNTLERLRAEAEKTGDYSKVFAYKRQQKKGK